MIIKVSLKNINILSIINFADLGQQSSAILKNYEIKYWSWLSKNRRLYKH
jgi:hypothetical protein